MAEKNFTNGSSEFNWFGAFWKFAQKWWEPEKENDNYWDSLVEASERFNKDYKAAGDKLYRFSKTMSVAYLEFLEYETLGKERLPGDETLWTMISLWVKCRKNKNLMAKVIDVMNEIAENCK